MYALYNSNAGTDSSISTMSGNQLLNNTTNYYLYGCYNYLCGSTKGIVTTTNNLIQGNTDNGTGIFYTIYSYNCTSVSNGIAPVNTVANDTIRSNTMTSTGTF